MKPKLHPIAGTGTLANPASAPHAALVVDDHHRMRRLETELLRQLLPGYAIEEADSAEAAIEAVTRHRPGLVLMDVHLPGIDGLEATRRILEIAPETTIIVVSLADDWRYFQLALEAGARAFVPKGTLHEALPALIARLVDTAHTLPMP